MPGDIVNLRRFRKTKARADKAREAEENRVRHGLTRADRVKQQAEQDLVARRLNGHKMQDRADTDDQGS